MKRLISLLLALVVVCSLCACGGKGKELDTSEGAEQRVEETAKIVVKDDATKEDSTDNINQNSKDIVESMSESSTDYLNECATFAQFVERNRDSYTTKYFEFDSADYTESDYQSVKKDGIDYLGVEDRLILDEKDFCITFEGVDYGRGDGSEFIEVNFTVYNKCPLEIDIHTNLIVNGITEGIVTKDIKSGKFSNVSVLVRKSVLAKSGSDKINSIRLGEIIVGYDTYSDPEEVKDEYKDAKGYIVFAPDITLGETTELSNIERVEGLSELYSDEAVDVWYVPSTPIDDDDSYYEAGLLLFINNKLKDRKISISLHDIDGYSRDYIKCGVEPDSCEYVFIGLKDNNDDTAIELSGKHNASFDLELYNMDGTDEYRHNLELNLDNIVHWE